ncbi:MAG: hypothetical protein ISR89_07260 [Candidatus Marinimicrobia bacterium]|nr:hypothetical protein [Candidatus Neomarinimicrobiota bacterium]MBL7030947.1 hypothetical protein [Candidatus Neomarinimicrobiota bacterium]
MATKTPDFLISKSDSLLLAHPDDAELRTAIIAVRLDRAKSNNSLIEYNKILTLDPKNSTARYHIYMAEGKSNHKKGHKNGQWDAIQSFAKAAAAIDTLGEPYYWMGLAYEKKDEMDFDLPLESYDKALSLYLTKEEYTKVKLVRESLMRRKKTYEDFWK